MTFELQRADAPGLLLAKIVCDWCDNVIRGAHGLILVDAEPVVTNDALGDEIVAVCGSACAASVAAHGRDGACWEILPLHVYLNLLTQRYTAPAPAPPPRTRTQPATGRGSWQPCAIFKEGPPSRRGRCARCGLQAWRHPQAQIVFAAKVATLAPSMAPTLASGHASGQSHVVGADSRQTHSTRASVATY